jgi:hypothetical protein
MGKKLAAKLARITNNANNKHLDKDSYRSKEYLSLVMHDAAKSGKSEACFYHDISQPVIDWAREEGFCVVYDEGRHEVGNPSGAPHYKFSWNK